MKKIAIFLMIAVLCLSVIATSCTRNGKNDKTEPETTEAVENISGEETVSDSEEATSEETTEEVTTDLYEEMTDGEGIVFPTVPV